MWLISLTTFSLILLIENCFYGWLWQVFEQFREKLSLDMKISVSLIPFIFTTCHISQEVRQVGRSAPGSLVVYDKAWKMKTRGISKSILFGLWGSAWALCQSSWELWWGTLMQMPSWVQFIPYLPHRAVHRVFVFCTTGTHRDHHPPAIHIEHWQHASLWDQNSSIQSR